MYITGRQPAESMQSHLCWITTVTRADEERCGNYIWPLRNADFHVSLSTCSHCAGARREWKEAGSVQDEQCNFFIFHNIFAQCHTKFERMSFTGHIMCLVQIERSTIAPPTIPNNKKYGNLPGLFQGCNRGVNEARRVDRVCREMYCPSGRRSQG